MTLTHHIGRITVNLKVPDAEQARDLQQEASALCRTEVRTALSKLFDEMAGRRVIRLDRLEVVLDPFRDADAFRSNFVSTLSAGIRETLRDALDSPPSVMAVDEPTRPEVFPAEWKSADLFLNVIKHGAPPWTTEPNGFDAGIKEVPDLLLRSREFRKAVKQVLKNAPSAEKRLAMQVAPQILPGIIGALTQLQVPWILEVYQAVETLFNKFNHGAKVQLNTHYAIIKAACLESVNEELFATASFGAALEKIHPARPPAPDQQNRISADQPPAPDQPDQFLAEAREISKGFSGKLRHLFQKALTGFTETHGQSGQGRFDRDAILWNDPKAKSPADHLKLSPGFPVDSSGQGDYPSIIDPGSQTATEQRSPPKITEDTGKDQMEPSEKDATEHETFLYRETEKAHTKKDGSHGAPGEATGTKGIAVQAGHGQWGTGVVQERKHEPGESDVKRQAPGPRWLTPPMEIFHIHNAGLVLLAPFFPSVFRDLNYVNKENKFVDDKAKIRAIHLIQFLVTGENFPAESDLLLNKLLCGLALEEPLERFLSLDEKERDMAMDLLLSAIGHWKTLKKTSAPVFRQTFLRHFGILDKQDESWRLRIERTTIDVLMDTLPWTISAIKHPWMHRPIMVEW